MDENVQHKELIFHNYLKPRNGYQQLEAGNGRL